MAGPFARGESAGTLWVQLEQRERLAGVGFLARADHGYLPTRGGLGTRENGNRASVYSAGEMEPLGQADSQAPQSMHFSGSMV